MKIEPFRACGICEVKDIPFGVVWPWWVGGRPAHLTCAAVDSCEITPSDDILSHVDRAVVETAAPSKKDNPGMTHFGDGTLCCGQLHDSPDH